MKFHEELQRPGLSVDEKIRLIGRAVKHLSSRAQPVATHSIPPVPISMAVQHPAEDGTVMKFIFPAEGRIKKAALFIEKFPVDERDRPISMVQLTAEFTSAEGSTTQNFDIYRKPKIMDLDIPVSPGDRLKVIAPAGVEGVWCGFLYEIAERYHKITQRMLDELAVIEGQELEVPEKD